MADVPEVAAVPGKAAAGLGHKLGPFPVWVWLVGGTIVVVVGYHFISTSQGGSGVNPLGGILPPGTFSGGSGTPTGGGTSDSGTTTTPVTPLTNAQWLSNVAPSVAAALQIPVSEASLYISQWLSGETPFGLNQAGSSLYNSVVGAAQATSFGAPPKPPSNLLNLNPYASNQSYLSALLDFIPSGTSQAIITELTNLYSGFTTSISQEAATVLQTAQGYAGLAPLPINYSITGGNGSGLASLSLSQFTGALNTLFPSGGGVLPTQSIWTSVVQSFGSLGGETTTALNNAFNLLSSAGYQPYVNPYASGSKVDAATGNSNQLTIINALLAGQAAPAPSSLATKT